MVQLQKIKTYHDVLDALFMKGFDIVDALLFLDVHGIDHGILIEAWQRDWRAKNDQDRILNALIEIDYTRPR